MRGPRDMASYLGAALHCASAPRAKPMGAVLAPLVEAALGALAPKHETSATKTSAKKKKTTTTNRRGAPR